VIIYVQQGDVLVLQPESSMMMADCRVAIILVMDIVNEHYDWFRWLTAGVSEEEED
jgi:hypothetical protein